MIRAWLLAMFMLRDLFRSLVAVVPLGVTLAFALIAFEYGMDQPQFVTVAGVAMAGLCLLNCLLLAGRANRGATYLVASRLPRRSELLAALVLGSVVLTAVLALATTVGNLVTGRLSLDFPSALWIIPTWVTLLLLAAALALSLSPLTSRAGSHLAGWVLFAAILVAYDQQERLRTHGLDWAARAVGVVTWPVSTLLSSASTGDHGRSYLLALGLALAYAALLFVVAVEAFDDKDLLWAE
ncbi:MAG TPA: hypothetical protein VLC95_03600 [Anaerolineae bacterium]|nr:hypothetical protein [Anaerolineae bacterium]